MATFVLVHGAWHGGWCYKRTAALLRAAGHEVYTPTMTGLGERAHLMSRSITLDTHVADIVGVLRCEELSDVVLCGHSYGGMVITGVAEKMADKIRSIVYLDAMLPDNGQSLSDIVGPELAVPFIEDAKQNGDGYLMTPMPAAVFNVNPKDAGWVDRMCVKHPLASFEQKMSLTGAVARLPKRTYILAEGWAPPAEMGGESPFVPLAKRLKQDKAWRVVSVPCGHDVMVDMPKELADLLVEAST
jgi:pimeloyl-ACP methyl ester carboxylesterase